MALVTAITGSAAIVAMVTAITGSAAIVGIGTAITDSGGIMGIGVATTPCAPTTDPITDTDIAATALIPTGATDTIPVIAPAMDPGRVTLIATGIDLVMKGANVTALKFTTASLPPRQVLQRPTTT